MSESTHAGYMNLPIARDPYEYDYRGDNPAESTYSYRQLRDQYAKPLAFNHVVPTRPQAGMSNAAYERALLSHLAAHSPRFERTDVAGMPLEMVAKYRDQIVKEALQAPGRRGELSSYTYTDGGGRDITEFAGPKSSWMNQFKSNVKGTGVTANGEHYRTVESVPLSAPMSW